jgi:putative lipoic acid-binding regulatory protein
MFLVFPFASEGQTIEVIQGHAHNDYENENPQVDALKNGYVSVEVDVYLIDDELLQYSKEVIG